MADTEQRCGNCGYLGKTFPWCRADKKGVKVTDGADCTKWSDNRLGPPAYVFRSPSVPVVPSLPENPTEEYIENAHQKAIEENMKRDAIRYVWGIARHAGYLHGVHIRVHGGGGVNYDLVANPYLNGEPRKQWGLGYHEGFDGRPEGAV